MIHVKVFIEYLEDRNEKNAKLRSEYNIPLILLSMGRSRAYYLNNRIEVPSFIQEITVETTGAGDTFGGCCLNYILEYGLSGLNKDRLKEMLTFANAAASIITTKKGALRVMPEVDEVKLFILNENKK